jgi:hypothetical protein
MENKGYNMLGDSRQSCHYFPLGLYLRSFLSGYPLPRIFTFHRKLNCHTLSFVWGPLLGGNHLERVSGFLGSSVPSCWRDIEEVGWDYRGTVLTVTPCSQT